MASIRRTQSPYHHHNGGGTAFSDKLLLPNGKYSPPPSSAIVAAVRSLLSALRSSSRRSPVLTWQRSFFRYSLFFALGFLLGTMPFGPVDDAVRRDFSSDTVVSPPFGRGHVANSENIVIKSVELGLGVENKLGDFVRQKQLIIITPTYNRALQAYFLHRLGQTLRLVPRPLLWIVVEMNALSVETADILRKTGVMYRHLVCARNSSSVKDRGVHQRNTALEHIERHRLDGVVYFADDDNVYSLELFESLRGIGRFGTWPVAMLAHSKNKAILEGPICDGSRVIGWHTNEKSKRLRRFHVDMSGFAFNSTILWDPKRWRRPTLAPIRQLDTVKEGFQETTFIEQVVEDEYQMEGIPPSCLKIMNWHLHLEASRFVYPSGWQLQKILDIVHPIV